MEMLPLQERVAACCECLHTARLYMLLLAMMGSRGKAGRGEGLKRERLWWRRGRGEGQFTCDLGGGGSTRITCVPQHKITSLPSTCEDAVSISYIACAM